MSSESNFAYSLKYNTHFIVRNITTDHKKTIKIFNYPINFNQTRDLLQIPGIQEADIRASLLKGVLRHKFLNGDIELVSSNIDLLQFSDKQRDFLKSFGFKEGIDIGVDELGSDTVAFIQNQAGGVNYLWKEEIPLIGLKNGTNRTFYTPDKFLNGLFPSGDQFHIHIKHNGKDLYEAIDYSIAESGGAGTGYDTINIFSFIPNNHSILYATYAIKKI